MKTMKTGIVLLALLLAAMAMVPMVSAADEPYQQASGITSSESQVVPDPGTIIDMKEAAAIAELNVHDLGATAPDFSPWKDASVQVSKTYYDLNDQVTAYAFDVDVDGKNNGYILISATTRNYPVLEVTTGNVPGSSDSATRESGQAIRKYAGEKGLTVTESKPVYLGALSYYQKYSVVNKDGVKQNDVFVDEHTNKIAEFATKSVTDKATVDTVQYENMQALKKADIKAQWDKQRLLISETPSTERTALMTSIQATRSSNSVYGVPEFMQNDFHNGCSPTSASMIVSYWSTHGYPALPSDFDTLFTELANQMGTGSSWPLDGSTWPWRIESAIDRVFYSYTGLQPASNDFLPGWSGFVSEINSGKPFILSMHVGGTAVGNSQAYGEHTVAVVGYVTSINNFITIHDTWNEPGVHLLQDNNWDNIMTTWVRP